MTQPLNNEADQQIPDHIDPENVITFKIEFYQYCVEGGFDKSAFESEEKATMMFTTLSEQHDPRNLIANAVSTFCKDPQYIQNVIPLFMGAYIKKCPEALQQTNITIDLRELIDMYQMNEKDVIDTFKIFAFLPNQIMALDPKNLEDMPPELQEITKAAIKQKAESGETVGCLAMKSDGTGLEVLTKEKYEEEFGEGSWENNIPEALKNAEELVAAQKEEPFVHAAPTSVN